MATAPPIILVLDISTLSATTTREWLGFSRAGVCYIPHVVYEEMRFLYERSPDPDLERVSREFTRFYASSGWQITEVTGHHSLLKSSTGHALTKRARVALAVARCALGLAQQHPKSMVVLVASDRSVLQRVYDIQAPNLTGIPGSALLQWSRSGQRPVAVSQKLQQMKTSGMLEAVSTGITSTYRSTSPTRITGRTSHSTTRRTGASRTQARSNTSIKPAVSAFPEWFPQAISILVSLAALASAGLVIWLIFFTNALDRFLPADPEPASTTETDG
ncbi:MAG: PIN domain-containing protein [Elainellaceae cyanobacterium]